MVLMMGLAMVGRSDGLGFWEALIEKDLKEVVVLREEMGLGKDGRWGLKERWRGW